jgi:hypothetical protein
MKIYFLIVADVILASHLSITHKLRLAKHLALHLVVTLNTHIKYNNRSLTFVPKEISCLGYHSPSSLPLNTGHIIKDQT